MWRSCAKFQADAERLLADLPGATLATAATLALRFESLLKSGGPLLGYNNNIPYKGNVYHVQTEDSGSKRPHVITHLFADGGRIVSTAKTSYADIVEVEDLSERVRALMREQHKKMVIALRDGEFDHLVDPSPPGADDAPPPDLAALEDEDAVPTNPAPPSGPLEGEVEPEPTSRPPSPSSPGSYSFVGSRSAPPKPSSPPRNSSPPPLSNERRPQSLTPATGSPVPLRSPSDAPPAYDVTAGGSRRRRSGPPRASQPPGAAGHFGARYVSDRRFDEVVLAFLKREQLS